MTGPEHFQKAEFFLAQVDAGAADWQLLAASAQVHATLALAAATAMQHYNFETGMHTADRDAWYRAASEGPADKARRKAVEQAEERES